MSSDDKEFDVLLDLVEVVEEWRSGCPLECDCEWCDRVCDMVETARAWLRGEAT